MFNMNKRKLLSDNSILLEIAKKAKKQKNI